VQPDLAVESSHAAAPACVPDQGTGCEFEVTVTLRVHSDNLEDIVAQHLADPCCLDVRVHSAAA
jgi:hypothetical protein